MRKEKRCTSRSTQSLRSFSWNARSAKENYVSVRLTWQEWPASPEGFEAMRREPHITNYFITEVP